MAKNARQGKFICRAQFIHKAIQRLFLQQACSLMSSLKLFLTQSVSLLSVSKSQNHNRNTRVIDTQPVQRLLSCLFCLLSERERARERWGANAEKILLFQLIEKTNKELHCCSGTRVFNSAERGMLVQQISDPCAAAKPKQIPFQTAHLHGSSLSPLLSQLKAFDIWGRVRVRFALALIGIHSALYVTKMKKNSTLHKNVASRGLLTFLSLEQIPASCTIHL